MLSVVIKNNHFVSLSVEKLFSEIYLSLANIAIIHIRIIQQSLKSISVYLIYVYLRDEIKKQYSLYPPGETRDTIFIYLHFLVGSRGLS